MQATDKEPSFGPKVAKGLGTHEVSATHFTASAINTASYTRARRQPSIQLSFYASAPVAETIQRGSEATPGEKTRQAKQPHTSMQATDKEPSFGPKVAKGLGTHEVLATHFTASAINTAKSFRVGTSSRNDPVEMGVQFVW